MSITEQMNKVIEKYGIEKPEQIIYGTNIPMPNAVLPTPWKTYIRFDGTQNYFFYFDEEGFSIFTTDGEAAATIPWSAVIDFKVSHIAIIGKITVKTAENTYKFQTNRFVVGCPWIKPNTKLLESNNYFYKK